MPRETRRWELPSDALASIGATTAEHEDVIAAVRRIADDGDVDAFEVALRATLHGGTDIDVTGALASDGVRRQLRVVGHPAFDGDGRIVAAAGVIIDVTEVYRSLEELRGLNDALREREDELVRMIDRTPGAMMVIDAEERIVSVNERFVSLFGYTLDDIPTTDAWRERAFPDPDYQERINELRTERLASAEAARARTTAPADIRIRCADGRFVDVEAHLTLFRDQRLVMFHDLTERKRVERELRRAAAVFHAGTQGIAIADAGLVIAAVNPSLERILGRAEDALTGRTLLEALGGGAPGAALQRTMEMIARDGHGEGEAWCRRADGQRIAVHVVAVSLRNADGRVIDHVVTITDVTAARDAERDLAYLAHHDPLTRLPNRHRFAEVLRGALDKARLTDDRVAVLFLDLDHFKTINDSLGHAVGDRMLAEIARRLTSTIRERDALARLGGDEFVVVLREASDDTAIVAVADRIRRAFDAPLTIGRRELRVGVSIGVSRFPDDGHDADTLLRNADAAMYRAKEVGRGGFRFYDPSYTDEAIRRLTLENALRDALATDALDVVFQPIVDVDSGRIVALEALARWHDGEEAISPEVFVAVAERTGTINALGNHVLERACRAAAPWIADGCISRIAVNVSGLQLRGTGFSTRVEELLARYALPSAALELELTETSLMRDVVEDCSELLALRELGVSLAVDDFGTGYSSLAQLKQLPVTALKIDRSFIAALGGDADDVAIVRAIVALGRALGLRVIAEGVETDVQLQFARALGCDLAQGWLMGRPADAAATDALLRRRRR